jgi:hypothetical protein
MTAPKVPRKPISKFTKKELDEANLCAKAIWYGINYETGATQKVSDANLMSRFAPYFYEYHQTKKKPNPDIFLIDVRDLILACGIKILFRGIAGMSFRKGINAIYTNVYPIFLKAQKNSSRVSSYKDAAKCLEQLSKGFVINPKDNRLSLASRILFFLAPNLQTFNMNNNIASSYGLQSRPHHHYVEYFELFAKGLITNQTALSKYKIPPARDDLDYKTWYEASKTDWWKRRVLDLAVLFKASPKIIPNPNLKHLIQRAITVDKEKTNGI